MFHQHPSHPQGLDRHLSKNISVTPADIKLWIQQAKQLGWMPNRSGKSFTSEIVGDRLQILN